MFVQDVAGGKPRAIGPEKVVFRFDCISPDNRSIVAIGADRRVAIYPTGPGEPRVVPGLETSDIPLALDGGRQPRSSSTARPRRRCAWTRST